MMQAFAYTGLPSRVVFGAGSLQHVEREVELLNASRVLIGCTAGKKTRGEALAARLCSRAFVRRLLEDAHRGRKPQS